MAIMATTIMITTTTTITMDTDGQSLLRLMTWLSPAFPVGAFAYSGGLERAVHDGLVRDADELALWLETLLTSGAWWNDAVLAAEAWHAHDNPARLADIMELAEALAGSAERHLEIMAQGEAFAAAAGAWLHPVHDILGEHPPYAIAIGAVAAAQAVPLDKMIVAFLHALASQGVSAAIRLGVLGQRQGVGILAALEPVILEVVERACISTLDDLGSATAIADLAAIRHETQHSRLFRS
jgi:urease accessory protein